METSSGKVGAQRAAEAEKAVASCREDPPEREEERSPTE
jgi:hypothetical protein